VVDHLRVVGHIGFCFLVPGATVKAAIDFQQQKTSLRDQIGDRGSPANSPRAANFAESASVAGGNSSAKAN
jgi:hypothetical protein